MITNFKHSTRRTVSVVAVLTTALLITFIAEPRLLQSQSGEQNPQLIPGGIPGTMNFEPGPRRMTGTASTNNGRLRLDIMRHVSDPSALSKPPFPTGGALRPIFDQLRNQYAENPDSDEILVEVTQRDGRTVTTVTANDNTFQVPNNNPIISELYALIDGLVVDGEEGLAAKDRITAPVLIHKVEPAYPATAKASGVYGNVMLTVGADEKGETRRVSAISGHPELSEASIAAVSQWRYEPALSSDGKPVPVNFGVVVHFLPDGTINAEVSDFVME